MTRNFVIHGFSELVFGGMALFDGVAEVYHYFFIAGVRWKARPAV